MSVYFVYRCHYGQPSEKYVKKFDDENVLAWFQKRWHKLANADDEAVDRLTDKELGTHVYGFSSIFNSIATHDLPVPRTESQLHEALEQYLYVEGETLFQPHCVQTQTDDDELEMAYYFFDDKFLAKHAKRAAFLLRQDWQLPEEGSGGKAFRTRENVGRIEPPGTGKGGTYLVRLVYYDGLNLTDLGESGPVFIPGVLVPDLAHWLATSTPSGQWPYPLRAIRSQLFLPPTKISAAERLLLDELRRDPASDAAWGVYSDWLEERGLPALGNVLLERALRAVARYPHDRFTEANDVTKIALGDISAARAELDRYAQNVTDSTHNPRKSLIHVGAHIAQIALHMHRWSYAGREDFPGDLYHQWIFFDDQWAAAHADLANGILRFANRWDVLSA